MRSVIDRIGRRSRSTSVRRARSAESIYVDTAPAGDPTYDPHGTSRPFRPTHRTHAARAPQKRSTYIDIERNRPSSETALNKVTEALRQNIQWRAEEHNLPEKIHTAGYGTVAAVAGVCVILLGSSLLAKAFPMGTDDKEVATDYAAATNGEPETKEPVDASTQIKSPTTDPDATAELSDNAQASAGTPMIDGISDSTMQLYVSAANSCNMPWQILAAVGRVETNHGTSNAAGVKSGENFAGAKGPMQFMQPTWDKYGLDANRDGEADIYNQIDSVYSAASYLCANGAGATDGIDNALWHYNHSDAYVSYVKETAASYYETAYRSPLPTDSVTDAEIGQPHHDYPAADLPVPVGTPVFAVRKGVVQLINNDSCGNGIQLDATDGVRYTYCHASQLNVEDGNTVDAGTVIMHSGGAVGSDGAGHSTGPHLHLEVAVNGQNVCPQAVLQAWIRGAFSSPLEAPATGCTY